MKTRLISPGLQVLMLALLLNFPALPGAWLGFAGIAMADDDDDRGGDDDDDDDNRRSSPRSSGGGDDDDDDSPRRASPRRQPAPVIVRLPTRVPDEIVALDLSAPDLALLIEDGFALLEEQALGQESILRRLRIPKDLALPEARAVVRALESAPDADFNHYYRAEEEPALVAEPAREAPLCEGPHCPALTQIDWPVAPSLQTQCAGIPVTIGMIDTGVNPDHAAFDGVKLEVIGGAHADFDASREVHGTAVAAVLAGRPDSRSPGLVPWMPLLAVDVFHLDGGDERADVMALVKGLKTLADRGVAVINLSLAGPPNAVLEETLQRLSKEMGIVLVAAAGNAGPRARPRYPAGYDTVIAVTAVDRSGRIYRRAVGGPHIDLAAPGVDIWTAASVSGARGKTGTSFAAPYVTAAVALILQANPALTPDEVMALLASSAKDIGDEGYDPVFGHGMLQATNLCR
ncbi:protease [Gemmobacter tilapiae]|uniref:Protease n=2 Tax=Neogemmobacter tilapiae TaxID=875041 RepID=A0A918TRK6_9RHOB|nr:protease [Gemmobacter tilapiae]